MGDQRSLAGIRPSETGRNRRYGTAPGRLTGRAECLEQLLLAFRDLADHDDIHQAGARLALVQQWIGAERERAAADPIFADLLTV